jgi:hypothetical protein
VRFVGQVHGEAKQALLEQARFVVLPSHSEGLPMTILEAWAAGTPTIMTGACHLPEGFAAGAALECGTEPASIAAVLGHALALDEPDWRAMSDAALGSRVARSRPREVTQQWVGAYRDARAHERAPPTPSARTAAAHPFRSPTSSSGSRSARSGCCCARFTPPPLFAWRRLLLRLFGAKIGAGVKLYGSTVCGCRAPRDRRRRADRPRRRPVQPGPHLHRPVLRGQPARLHLRQHAPRIRPRFRARASSGRCSAAAAGWRPKPSSGPG